RLQQCVERMRGEHVHFVDEVYLVSAPGRRVLNVVQQLAGVIDFGIRRSVDLDEVNKSSGINLAASSTGTAGSRGNADLAIEALGENARDGRFTDTASTGEQKRVVDPPGLERVCQRPTYVLLSDELCKFFGAPGSRQRGI